MTALITGQELAERLDQPDLTIVDVRALSAYNGWRAGGHGPGGHVPGAASFPVSWLDTLDDPEMEHLLADKGVLPGRSIVVYGQRPDLTDAEQFATRLAERGIADVRVLVGGFEAWLADSSRPVDRLARYDRLVDIDWLAEVLAGGRPEAGPTGRFLLFHVNFDAPDTWHLYYGDRVGSPGTIMTFFPFMNTGPGQNADHGQETYHMHTGRHPRGL